MCFITEVANETDLDLYKIYQYKMIKYNILTVKLFNLQLHKLKAEKKWH